MEKENIWIVEEKKNGEGKGGKYLEKEKVMTVRQMYKISSCFLLWKVSSKKTCIVNLVPQEPPPFPSPIEVPYLYSTSVF